MSNPQIGNGAQRFNGGGCLVGILLPFVLVAQGFSAIWLWANENAAAAILVIVLLVVATVLTVAARRRAWNRTAQEGYQR